MEKSLLDYIPQRNHDYTYKWANGAIGSISDRKLSLTYRFHIGDMGDKDQLGMVILQKDDDAPIVAAGIVAYWLHFRENPNRLAAYGTIHKTISEIFRDYTDDQLTNYRKKQEQVPSSWRSDYEKDFYLHFIIPNERKLNKQSEALFEYITPDDRQVVRDVMKEYILYLQEQRERYLPDMQKPKDAKQHKPERKVNIDEIGKHIKIGFDKKTYLPILKTLLETSQSDKDLAKVALLIYDSKYFLSNDYRTFSKWYRDYCKHVGCEFHSSYEPSKLRPIDRELEKRYYFLM